MANRYEANRVRVTGGHVRMQAMVKMETGSPSSNMPTRHGLLQKKRGVVGDVGLEGWRCWFGSGWVEEWGRGVSVSIRHRLTADSCVRRDHGQLTRTRPELASCVCLCTCVSVPTPQPPPATRTHIDVSSSIQMVVISFSPSLPFSILLPPQPFHDIFQVNQYVSTSWHESTTFIQSTPCLSYLLK